MFTNCGQHIANRRNKWAICPNTKYAYTEQRMGNTRKREHEKKSACGTDSWKIWIKLIKWGLHLNSNIISIPQAVTIEYDSGVCGWISNFTPHYTGHAIIHPCWGLKLNHVSKWPPVAPWISNHMPRKVRAGITYPFLNFSGCTVEF